MNKRHFIAIAKMFAVTRPVKGIHIHYNESLAQWTVDIQHIADVCEMFDPQFNRSRFIEACND